MRTGGTSALKAHRIDTVTPVSFNGGAGLDWWYLDSRDGKPASQVLSCSYGCNVFKVTNATSTTKSYSSEYTFGVGASVPTPAGTFTPSVSTPAAAPPPLSAHVAVLTSSHLGILSVYAGLVSKSFRASRKEWVQPNTSPSGPEGSHTPY